MDRSVARTWGIGIILGGVDSHPTAGCAGAHRGQRRSGIVAGVVGVPAVMIGPPTNTQIWIAAGVTDLRRGFTGLSALVQTQLEQRPFSGHVFVFRGRRGDLIKLLWFDGDGLCLLSKRLERGRFIWPQATSGTVSLTRAQLSMLLEGIDWRRPVRTWDGQLAV
jgi:transposase